MRILSRERVSLYLCSRISAVVLDIVLQAQQEHATAEVVEKVAWIVHNATVRVTQPCLHCLVSPSYCLQLHQSVVAIAFAGLVASHVLHPAASLIHAALTSLDGSEAPSPDADSKRKARKAAKRKKAAMQRMQQAQRQFLLQVAGSYLLQ